MKKLLIPMPVALHTKLKWRAKQEGQPMTRVVRSLIMDYVDGGIEIDPAQDPTPPPGRPVRATVTGGEDVYDKLYAMIEEVVE